MRRILTLLAMIPVFITGYAQNAPAFVWGSTDVRYAKDTAPKGEAAPVLKAWKGERVNLQAVYSAAEQAKITVKAGNLKSGKNVIPAEAVSISFVDYVIVDAFGSLGKDMGLQPDRLVNACCYDVNAGETCPVWFTVSVPQSAAPGKYKGTVTLDDGKAPVTLAYTLTVIDRVLPEPEDWTFHLDLWQNPYAVARYFNVPLWSEEHFARMRPIMEKYASAGGKAVTASIIQHPWNCQTYDPFESMIVKSKHLDGSWTYDYSVFDKWIEFAFTCGDFDQIDCYTIVPWGYTFEYFDLATATVKNVDCKPGEQAYEDILLPFLTDFAKHLRAKGWFYMTCIAMDERPMDQLMAARKLVRKADPEYRIAGAVNYSPEVVDIMYDISLGYAYSELPQEVILQRNADGLQTTIYTCCGPERPNTFTFSPLAESEFLGISAAARHFTGYLRWALNSWPEDPCKDSRFGHWVSGDTYLLYPEGSSMRFERFIEGVQDYEKIRIIRESGNAKACASLESVLEPMKSAVTDESLDAAAAVRAVKAELNK